MSLNSSFCQSGIQFLSYHFQTGNNLHILSPSWDSRSVLFYSFSQNMNFRFWNWCNYFLCWWLVRGTLLMEWGLLPDFCGNFSTWGERYYFCMEGSTQGWHKMRTATPGENGHARWLLRGGGDNLTWLHARWQLPCEVRMVMQGYFCMVEGTTEHKGMWGGLKLTIAMWGENGHMRWLLHGRGDNLKQGHMRWMWGDNCHARWEWSHEVTVAWWKGQLTTQTQGGCEMRMAMQGENGHAR